jgi:hypothetical protein
MYQLNVYKIINNTSNIELSNKTSNLIQNEHINLPLISLGFHSFINRTKKSLSITNKLQTQNDFYYVVNPFEYKILNYDDSLDILTEKYLNKKIDSSSFYELWEIFFVFDLVNNNELTCAVIANNTSGIINSIVNFKQKLGLINPKDKIFNVSLNNIQNNEEFNKSLLGMYNKQYPNLIKSYKGEFNNITDIKTITQYKKEFTKLKTLANLIIANCKFKSENNINQEQEAYTLILGEIIAALKTQKINTHFIIKIYDTFTLPTLKLIYILSSCYKSTYIYKPFFTRPSQSDKYIICKEFIYEHDDTRLNNNIKILENILENINTNLYIYDIFPNLILPQDFINQFKFINIKNVNSQQIMINDIISYIKENNYFGDKYHFYKNEQIAATKWWLLNFFPPSNNLYIKNKEDLHKLLNSTIEKHDVEFNKFISQLVFN